MISILDQSRTTRAWLPLATGVIVSLMAVAFALSTQGPGGIAAIWPVNAVVLAILLRVRRSDWPLILLSALIGNTVANAATGDDALRGALLSLGNTLEIGMAATLCRAKGSLRLMRRSGLVRFVIAILFGCAASTAVAFVTLAATGSTLAPQGALLWLAADFLGLAVFTPILLALLDGRLAAAFAPPQRVETLLLLTGLILSTAAVFYQKSFPLLFIPPAIVVLVGLRIGLAGTCLGILLVAGISISLSIADRGPLTLMDSTIETRVLILQLFLGILTLIALVSGTVAAERNALIARMSRARVRAQKRGQTEQRFLRYARLAETMSQVGYWTYSTDTQDIFWSPEVYRIHGLDPEQFVPTGERVSQLYTGQDRETLGAAGARCLTTGEPWEIDLILHRASDGSRREVRCVGSAETGPNGEITGLFGVFKDLTEERHVIAQAVAHEKSYRLLAENSTDVIAVYGVDGTFSYLSPSMLDLLGYRPDELIGRKTFEIIVPEDHDMIRSTFRAEFAFTRAFTVEYRAITKDGRVRWLEARPRFQRDDKGGVIEITDTVRDVTLRRERETALSEARHRAEQASQAKARFLANMSHEIRTPLTGILGFAGVLAETELDTDQTQYVDRIRRAGRGLSTLIDDVLDMSRIESGEMTVDPHGFDLRDLVAEVVALTQAACFGKPLEFTVDIAPSIAARIVGDSFRLRQILLNLLGNATKFTTSGTIQISARQARGMIDIRVIDPGVGIAPEDLARLFESFTQADAAVARYHGGSGLGLSISRHLARLMGGDVNLSSKVGQGTTAKLVLPYVKDAAATTDRSAIGEADTPTSQRLSIMLVDDVEMNRELFNIILANLGHRTLTFDNAPAAIEALKSGEDVDLILMDVQMPDMDGLEAARQIRRIEGRPCRIPIIALSANVMPEQVEGCLAAGMNAHLGKPFTEQGLQSVMLSVMQGWNDAQTGDEAVLSAAVEKLRYRYRSTLSAILSQLDCQLPISTLGQDMSGIHAIAHQIVGTAGALGMPELSKAAAKLAQLSATGSAYPDGGRAFTAEVENLRSALTTEMSRQDTVGLLLAPSRHQPTSAT